MLIFHKKTIKKVNVVIPFWLEPFWCNAIFSHFCVVFIFKRVVFVASPLKVAPARLISPDIFSTKLQGSVISLYMGAVKGTATTFQHWSCVKQNVKKVS